MPVIPARAGQVRRSCLLLTVAALLFAGIANAEAHDLAGRFGTQVDAQISVDMERVLRAEASER
jgi:hypothetical protein